MSKISTLKNQCRKHLTRYEYPQVIENCDKILEIDQESWWGLKYKGVALYKTEQYDKAIPVYKKHYQLYPDDEDTMLTLIDMYEKEEKYVEALKICEKIPKTTKNKQKQLLSKMNQYTKIINEYDEKIKRLENMIKPPIKQVLRTQGNTQQYPKKFLNLIILLEEKALYQYVNGEHDKAYQTFQKVLKNYSPVLNYSKLKKSTGKWYERLELLFNNCSSSEEFFNELFKLDNIEAWRQKLEYTVFRENLFIYTDILLEKNPDNIQALKLVGESSYSRYFDYSLKCWKKLLEIEPENREAIQKILKIYSRQYSKDRALKLINSKLYIKDMKTDLLVEKIRLLESMTFYDEALEVYDEYLSLDLPDGLTNHKLTVFDKMGCVEKKALTLYMEENLHESFKIYKMISEIFRHTEKQSSMIKTQEWYITDWYCTVLGESIRKSRDNPEKFYKEFYENKENVKLWIKKIEHLQSYRYHVDPLQYYDILMKKFPEDIGLKVAKANYYYKKRKLTEALEIYEEILEKEQDNPITQDRIFSIYTENGKYDKAYEYLKTIEINFNEIRYNISKLADFFFNIKDYEKAKYCYEILLDNNHESYTILFKLKYIWNTVNDTESQNRSQYYIDWISKINYMHDKYECPECGGELIPVRYGYFPINDEEVGIKYHLGGCCVRNDSPTDYCRRCQKEIYMGTYGIDITTDDYMLLCYTQENIKLFTDYIEKNPTKNIVEIEQLLCENLAINKKEFTIFLEKLEKIGYIKIENNHIKLNEEYKKFHNIIISGSYYAI